MSSLVLFIYPIMYNLVSVHCLHRHKLSMLFACCPHMCTSFACHLYHSSYTLLSTTKFRYILSPQMHIVNIMCILSTDAYVMYISFLLLLFAYVHIICTLSEHMCIMCTLFAVVLDIFLPNRQCRCHAYVISSTLYISHHVQLSFCTLSAQTHIVHVVCMLSTHVHIICLSSLPLLIYLIIHNLVSAHCLHTCILSMSSVYCLEMHMLCTCHLYSCYLYVYMSSTYYLGIYVLCAHYLKWSLICSFLTDNTNVIHTSSLVLFIYSIMYNLVSAHCLHRCTLSMSFACCPHMYASFACHL